MAIPTLQSNKARDWNRESRSLQEKKHSNTQLTPHTTPAADSISHTQTQLDGVCADNTRWVHLLYRRLPDPITDTEPVLNNTRRVSSSSTLWTSASMCVCVSSDTCHSHEPQSHFRVEINQCVRLVLTRADYFPQTPVGLEKPERVYSWRTPEERILCSVSSRLRTRGIVFHPFIRKKHIHTRSNT